MVETKCQTERNQHDELWQFLKEYQDKLRIHETSKLDTLYKTLLTAEEIC